MTATTSTGGAAVVATRAVASASPIAYQFSRIIADGAEPPTSAHGGGGDNNEGALQEELESVEACFPDEYQRLQSPDGRPLFRVALSLFALPDFCNDDSDALALQLRLPAGYPARCAPQFEFQLLSRGGGDSTTAGGNSSRWCAFAVVAARKSYSDFSAACVAAAEEELKRVLTDNPGEHVVLQLVAAAQQRVEEFLLRSRATSKSAIGGLGSGGNVAAAGSGGGDGDDDHGHDHDDHGDDGLCSSVAGSSGHQWWNREFLPDEAPTDGNTEGEVSAEESTRLRMVEAALAKAAASAFAGAAGAAPDGGGPPAPLHYASSQKGAWNFVVGLVGKPSAGKSTFFNAASRCVRGCCLGGWRMLL